MQNFRWNNKEILLQAYNRWFTTLVIFSPPQQIQVNDTLVAVLHFQRSFKLGNISQKHRYQLALINIKILIIYLKCSGLILKIISWTICHKWFWIQFFWRPKHRIINYYLVDPNSLDDKARYLIKINLEGQIFENYQHLQYQENAYSSRLIYFGKYKGKDLYGGFLPTKKVRLRSLYFGSKCFGFYWIHNRKY